MSHLGRKPNKKDPAGVTDSTLDELRNELSCQPKKNSRSNPLPCEERRWKRRQETTEKYSKMRERGY